MTAIKALEKLRIAARNMAKGRNLEHHEECNLLLRIADKIEADVAERFMRLPVDVHDAPIHVGDEIQQLNHAGVWTDAMPVIAVDENGCFALAHGIACEARTYVWGNNCRHVEPRTLEDVLRDYGDEYHKACTSDYTVNLAGIYRKYADEMRDLLGVDE